MQLDTHQKAVATRVAISAVVTVSTLLLAIRFLPVNDGLVTTLAERLEVCLVSELLVVIWLFVCIGRVANLRFFSTQDRDGAGLTTASERARVLQAILQNTLEQVVMTFIIHLAWAILMPSAWLAAIPAGAVLFSVGRLLFMRGYSGGAPGRALGFALTYQQAAIMYAVMVIYLLVDLF